MEKVLWVKVHLPGQALISKMLEDEIRDCGLSSIPSQAIG